MITKEKILEQTTGKTMRYLRGNFVTVDDALKAMSAYAHKACKEMRRRCVKATHEYYIEEIYKIKLPKGL